MIPTIAIVGRPNVGKSSLLNALVRKRISIVDPTAGVTRDRITFPMEIDGKPFDLCDTGGMGIEDCDNLTDEVELQIRAGMDEAVALLFVVDGQTPITKLDQLVADRIRKSGKPILLVINKCDYPEQDVQSAEWMRAGFNQFVCSSAKQSRGREEILAWIGKHIPKDGEHRQDTALTIALVGRRNAGKSTFLNSLVGSERMIVSEVAGTTRDSVDIHMERDGQNIVVIDTAGVRKRKSVKGDIEFYSLKRAQRAMRRAQVTLHLLDSSIPISRVDKQLADFVLELGKPVIFVANKWDLMAPRPTGEYAEYLQKIFPFLDFVPVAFTTAKSGRNLESVLHLARHLHKQAGQRVTTGELNRVIHSAMVTTPPPLRNNRRAKIYFATQTEVFPPTIICFTNGEELIEPPYQKFLLREIRDKLAFNDVPIRLLFRGKEGLNREDKSEPKEGVAPDDAQIEKETGIPTLGTKPKAPRKPIRRGPPKKPDKAKKNKDTPGKPGVWKDL
jgi:GTP-binding protein